MRFSCSAVGGLVMATLFGGCKSEGASKPSASSRPVVVAPPPAGIVPPPADVAGPPKDAERTEAGLACIVPREGTGTEHPGGL